MRWSLVVLSLASCFDPTYPEIGCGPDDWCPAGQSCGNDGLCHHPPDAAAPPDAVRADGPVGPDASPADAPVTIDAAPDTTPPTATHTPASAVLDDDVAVVITFSESMDTASLALGGTLAAYDHSTTWTTTTFPDDTLTVAPAVATPFWPATEPVRSLTVNGADLAGNALATVTITYDAPPLRSFTRLGSAVPLGGLASFDVLCRTEAESAGLPGVWVAWVSSSTNDVYCRLHGLAGKRATNCGQATLPSSAGPWVRTDDTGFLELVFGTPRFLSAPYMATGGFFAFTGIGDPVWSSTDASGAFTGGTDCGEWTNASTTGTVTAGVTGMGTYWTNATTGSCADNNKLVCLEVGRGGPLPAPTTGRRVFVTAAAGSGNLSTWAAAAGNTGAAAGDAICRSQAAAAGLPNSAAFKAWLSTSTQDAATHLTSDGAWVRHDGLAVVLAKSWLSGGLLSTSILYDQNGTAANVAVFTGTTSGGTVGSATCSGWTSGTATAVIGHSDLVGPAWTNETTQSCNVAAHLLCFED